MKRFIKFFFVLLVSIALCNTHVFADDLKGALSISWAGIKFNNPSTNIQVITVEDTQENLIDFASLKSGASFAMDFSFDWYVTNHSIFFGIVLDCDLGSIVALDPGFKFGYYNDYINVFCKVGLSYLRAELDASKTVYWTDYERYGRIETITFEGMGYNFGLGLDVHPYKKPFFVRLSYDYESCHPDIKIKTPAFTEKINAKDSIGDFYNKSFTIAIGWQYND